MLRYMMRCSKKLSLKKNSRSFQSSSVFNDDKKHNKDDIKEFIEQYWNSPCPDEDPIGRTHRVMSKQMRQIKNKIFFWKEPRPTHDEWAKDSQDFPSHVDVVIVGNNAIANSIAYFLKKKAGESFSIVVLENEDTDKPISPIFTMGGLTMQYSLPENIELALHSSEFMRNIHEHLEIDDKLPYNINFQHQGFLNLATEAGAEQLAFNSKMQHEMGIKNKILTQKELATTFPWLNTEDIALGCLGLEREGVFNADVLNMAFKKKAQQLGTEYAIGEVKGFIFSKTPNMAISTEYKADLYRKLNHLVVKTPDGEKKIIQYAFVILAAGHDTLRIAELARIGKCTGVLSVPLPIDCRKRCVYSVEAPNGPNLNTPITLDPSGCIFRRDGLVNNYLIARTPQEYNEEQTISNLEVDPAYFDNIIYPQITHRVPSFKNLKIKSSYAAYIDYNKYDENGILGQHPLYGNMIFACGFGVNTAAHSPAIGRAVAEIIADTGYSSINLERFKFDRFITQEPQIEAKIL